MPLYNGGKPEFQVIFSPRGTITWEAWGRRRKGPACFPPAHSEDNPELTCHLRGGRPAMGSRLKELLAQKQLVRVFGLGQLCHPKFVEIVALQGGYDAVWLDQEHAGLSIAQIE